MDMLVQVLLLLIKVGLALVVVLTCIAYATLMERKVMALVQVRYGPNRVGPWGLLQPLADGFKLLFKEEVTVERSDKGLYLIAPLVVLITAILPFAVIPWGRGLPVKEIFGVSAEKFSLNQGFLSDINVGLLYIFAISSLGVYGFVLAGWSSNSKYSLLGGLRASAQMVSYEVALGLSIIGVLMMSESLSLAKIVEEQAHFKWFIWRQPLGFILFVIAASAEICRTPFDFIECESEIVAGYQTEYSSMKFALFYLAEYGHLVFIGALLTTLFLGGWDGPLLMPWMWFSIKTFIVVFFFIWVRATYPRMRYDQLMRFGWKVLLPATLLNIMLTGLLMQVWPWYRGL